MSPAPVIKILVVDDEINARQALVSLLSEDGYLVRDAADGYKALGVIESWSPDIILTDMRMPLMDGLSLIKKVRQDHPEILSIVMTAFASVDTAIDAMKAGAHDYLIKPLNIDAVELVLHKAAERLSMRRELDELRQQVRPGGKRHQLLGASAPMQELKRLIEQVAPSRATVLITGESGTGKEIIARQLHQLSPRADKPFIALHCAALPETLLEDELFGHEKGAFTGATATRQGRFEEAQGGTLFLDEIGEISPATQVKLLRVLQERTLNRLGGRQQIELDVRLVCATNRDLQREVEEGRFREDLYYRLNVIHISSPPLRHRRADIPLLVQHFVARFARENFKQIDALSAEAAELLERYDWPGNVRELENSIERAVVLSRGDTLEAEHLPAAMRALSPPLRPASAPKPQDAMPQVPGASLAELERYALLRTYEACGGNTKETAQILDISQRKVQYRLQAYKEGKLK